MNTADLLNAMMHEYRAGACAAIDGREGDMLWHFAFMSKLADVLLAIRVRERARNSAENSTTLENAPEGCDKRA